MDKLAKEKMMKLTKPFDKCPVCGGELEEKEVEKLLRGGEIQEFLPIIRFFMLQPSKL